MLQYFIRSTMNIKFLTFLQQLSDIQNVFRLQQQLSVTLRNSNFFYYHLSKNFLAASAVKYG